jgi:hypothetical protein
LTVPRPRPPFGRRSPPGRCARCQARRAPVDASSRLPVRHGTTRSAAPPPQPPPPRCLPRGEKVAFCCPTPKARAFPAPARSAAGQGPLSRKPGLGGALCRPSLRQAPAVAPDECGQGTLGGPSGLRFPGQAPPPPRCGRRATGLKTALRRPLRLTPGSTCGAKGIAIGMGVCDKERCNLLPFVTSAFRQNF